MDKCYKTIYELMKIKINFQSNDLPEKSNLHNLHLNLEQFLHYYSSRQTKNHNGILRPGNVLSDMSSQNF